MLLALMGGEALPAGELARVARLSAAATSIHLAKLVRGGLLAVRREGRHRYYRLASADVARAVEQLGLPTGASPTCRALTPAQAVMRSARSCYDHLAGRVAVALADHLEYTCLLTQVDDFAWDIAEPGRRWFGTELQIEVDALARGRRVLARRCLDWTERRPHIAGALGAAIMQRCLERRWFTRVAGSRALRLTPRGAQALRALGVSAPL